MDSNIIEMGEQPRAITAPTAAPATPADIVLYAMQKGADIAQIEKFMDLQMKWEADKARKAFVADMAEFKKTPPEIVKDKLVGYKNKDGSVTGYMHATIGNVTEAIVAGLAAHGFSHRWDTEQTSGQITVTCILTHKLGHSERTALSGAKDDSGKKNQIQQMASTITYLQRYTLLAATGVATKDQSDDDGASSQGAQESEKASAKEKLVGPRFDKAIAAVRAGQYDAKEMRAYYELTIDQDAALSDVEKELAK